MIRLLFFICFLTVMNVFAQQNEEFESVKNYYNYHRTAVGREFKTKFDEEKNPIIKEKIQKTFFEIMKKLDSLENQAYLYALITTKNKENLNSLFPGYQEATNKPEIKTQHYSKNIKIDQDAHYPDGMDNLRKEIAQYFYLNAIKQNLKTASTIISFIVEKDGQITHVKAEGTDPGFNIQAEIAVYRLKNKFIPAYIDGQPARYKFKVPLTMHFD